MRRLVFLLEEPSAEALIKGVLPKLLEDERLGIDLWVQCFVFEGKQQLELKMTQFIRNWKIPGTRFVVLRDQDLSDCREVKQSLESRVRESGKADATLVRVACRELEAWILGDWQAIAQALDRPKLARHEGKSSHRRPDDVYLPVVQLRKFIPDYQKLSGARRIGPWLDPERNRSPSFRAFCRGVQRLVSATDGPLSDQS